MAPMSSEQQLQLIKDAIDQLLNDGYDLDKISIAHDDLNIMMLSTDILDEVHNNHDFALHWHIDTIELPNDRIAYRTSMHINNAKAHSHIAFMLQDNANMCMDIQSRLFNCYLHANGVGTIEVTQN